MSQPTIGLAGIATLPAILAIVILIVTIGVGITSITFTQTTTSAGASQSLQALFYADSGARDALQRIARNKTYLCASPNPCYTIDFVQSTGCSNDDGCARVTVTGNETSKTITSAGQVRNNIRNIQVTVTLDGNGGIAGTAWTEI